jgi:hypothetical protein
MNCQHEDLSEVYVASDMHLLVCIVHVIVDGIDSRSGTSVLTDVTPTRGAKFSRRVADVVALKRVDETQSVACLVRRDLALVERKEVAAWHGSRVEGAAVVKEVGISFGDTQRIVAPARDSSIRSREVVQVEILVVALPQSLLHGCFDLASLLNIIVLGTDSPVDVLENEGEAAGGKGLVQYLHLLVDKISLVIGVLCQSMVLAMCGMLGKIRLTLT